VPDGSLCCLASTFAGNQPIQFADSVTRLFELLPLAARLQALFTTQQPELATGDTLGMDALVEAGSLDAAALQAAFTQAVHK
jgi:hypothetical protein